MRDQLRDSGPLIGFRAVDTTDLNFALAKAASPSYAFSHVQQATEDRAELLLYLLRIRVFWCGAAEPLRITLSSRQLQPTTGGPGRWVFHFET